MRKFAGCLAITMAFATSGVTPTAPVAASAAAPQATLQSIGPLAFGPNDVLFAADTQGATIYAFQLGKAATGSSEGTPDVAAIDQKIASVLGTDAAAIAITDLAIHPTSKNEIGR